MLTALGIQLVVSSIAGMILSAMVLVNTSPLDETTMFTALMEASVKYAVLITGISCLITIPLSVLFYKKDLKLNKIHPPRHSVPAYCWLLLMVTGILTCIGSNIIITISQLDLYFSSYEQVSQQLYAGNFIIQLAVIGFIAPIAEELIFRGLIYNRAKAYFGHIYAVILSSLIFAFYHGNAVQFIYALVIGLMMAYIYEKFGSLKAPIIFHICCNLPALILQQMHITINSLYTAAYIATGCCAAVILLLFVMHKIIQTHQGKHE